MQRMSAACKALVLAHLVLVPAAAEVGDAVGLLQNTASVFDSPSNEPAPATHHHSTASSAVPSTQHHSTASSAVPATHHLSTASSAVPSTQHHSTAPIAVPSTQHHSTASSAVPATHHLSTASSAVPSTHHHSTASSAVPSTHHLSTASSAMPATHHHSTASSAVPSTHHLSTASSAVPATHHHSTASSAVPSTHHHSTASSAVPATHHHSTASSAVPSTHHRLHRLVPSTHHHSTASSAVPATHHLSTANDSLSHSEAQPAEPAQQHFHHKPAETIMSVEEFSKLSLPEQKEYLARKKQEVAAGGAKSDAAKPWEHALLGALHNLSSGHSLADTLAHHATAHSAAGHHSSPAFPMFPKQSSADFQKLKQEAKHVVMRTKDKRSKPQKIKHSGERTAASAQTVMTDKERLASEMEADLDRFGAPLVINVRGPSGKLMPVNFRKSARLQFLKDVVCKKLDLKVNHTHFTYKGDELEDNLTPEIYGITHDDIIDVDSFELQERIQRDVNSRHKAEIRSKVLHVAEMAHAEGLNEDKVADRVAAAKKKYLLEEKKAMKKENELNDRILLRFKNPLPKGKDVRVSVKKDLPLESAFDLVVKKMGLFGVATSFHYGPGARLPIRGEDVPADLKLKDETDILVRGPAEKKVIEAVHKGEAKKEKRKQLKKKLLPLLSA